MKQYLLTLIAFSLFSVFGFAESIEIPLGQDSQFMIEHVTKYLILDPQLMTVKSLQKTEVILSPLKTGKTVIYFWTDKGRQKVDVVIKSKQMLSAVQQAKKYQEYSEKSDKNILASIIGGIGQGESQSKFANNNFNYNFYYLSLQAKGPTIWGDLDAKAQYKGNNQFSALQSATIKLHQTNSDWILGNQWASLSNAILPGQEVQGIRYRYETKDLKYNVFLGQNRYGLFGANINREYRVAESIGFAGIEKRLMNEFYVGGNYVFVNNQNSQIVNIASLTAKLYPTQAKDILFDAEIGSDDQKRKTLLLNSQFTSPVMVASAKYKRIDPGFQTAYGFLTYQGNDGYFLATRVMPLTNFTFSLNYDKWRDSFMALPTNVDNEKYYGVAAYQSNSAFIPDLTLTAWNFYQQKLSTSIRNNQRSLELRASKRISKLDIYAGIQPSNYTNNNDVENQVGKAVLGVAYPVINGLSMTGELEQQNSKGTAIFAESSQRISMYFMDFPVATYPVFLGGFLQFKRAQRNTETDPRFLFFYQLEGRYQPNQDFFIRLTKTYTFNDEPDILKTDSKVDILKCELGYTFDTGFNLNQGNGIISGMVFNDINHNSKIDENETGLSEIPVHLSNGLVVKTDIRGIYRFVDLKPGDYDVSLVISDLPANRLLTAANSQKVYVKAFKKENANFGVRSMNRFVGSVFIDENSNGQRDSGEEGIANVIIRMNDQKLYTDNEGRFETDLSMISSELKTVVDLSSLSTDYLPIASIRKNWNLTGQEIEIRFDVPVRRITPILAADHQIKVTVLATSSNVTPKVESQKEIAESSFPAILSSNNATETKSNLFVNDKYQLIRLTTPKQTVVITKKSEIQLIGQITQDTLTLSLNGKYVKVDQNTGAFSQRIQNLVLGDNELKLVATSLDQKKQIRIIHVIVKK